MTGLGAAGCTCIMTWIGHDKGLRPSHPFVPTLHVAVRSATDGTDDCDAILSPKQTAEPVEFVRTIIAAAAVACGGQPTKALRAGCVDYAIPRELGAVSL